MVVKTRAELWREDQDQNESRRERKQKILTPSNLRCCYYLSHASCAQYVMGSSFPNLILLIASSGSIAVLLLELWRWYVQKGFQIHPDLLKILLGSQTFCRYFPSVLVPLFLVFSGFSSIARTTTKPRIERSVTLFSVVPIASHVTQKGQQQQLVEAETHKRRKKKSLPSSLEETARRDEGSLVVKDEVARYASGPVKEIIKWKVSKPAE